MRPGAFRGAAELLLFVLLAAAVAGCGSGGFSSAAPPPPEKTIRSYVALGDGFTAAPYVGKTSSDDGCLRSGENYPALAARKLGLTSVIDVSCTHATTEALTKDFKAGKGKPLKPQLDAVTEDTDLVSIGAGIEDHGLLQEMFRICLARPCAAGTVFYTQVLDDVNRAADSLTQAIRALQEKAPEAYIVVVGYPRLTPPPESGCKQFPAQAPQADRDVVNYVLDGLNDKIRSAARQTGSGYVDVATLSEGHELCSSEPWVHSMTDKPGKAVAYHPLEAEQRAVAEQLVTEVKER